MKIIRFKFLLFISLCTFSGYIYGQDISAIINEADQLNASMNDGQAFMKYKEALTIQPANVYILCRCSELCSAIGGRVKDDEAKQNDYFTAAKAYAEKAIQLSPTSSDANFVMGLAMGREALRRGGKEKIAAVKDIKKYADLSIKYNPQNFKSWFLLGKWYYEIQKLSYFERIAVKIFYGALPPATIEDAIICMEKSKSLNPGFIMNYLSLAKAYKTKDEDKMAVQYLTVMLTLPDKTQDDEIIKKEGRDLLKKWN